MDLRENYDNSSLQHELLSLLKKDCPRDYYELTALHRETRKSNSREVSRKEGFKRENDWDCAGSGVFWDQGGGKQESDGNAKGKRGT
jgi:hypothetical protein